MWSHAHLDAGLDVVIKPPPEFEVIGIDARNPLEKWEQPHQMAEKSNHLHVSVQLVEEVLVLIICEHVKRLSE